MNKSGEDEPVEQDRIIKLVLQKDRSGTENGSRNPRSRSKHDTRDIRQGRRRSKCSSNTETPTDRKVGKGTSICVEIKGVD